MPLPIRCLPVRLEGDPAYELRGDPAELVQLVDAMTSPLDDDAPRRGFYETCRAWVTDADATHEDIRDELRVVADRVGVDLVFEPSLAEEVDRDLSDEANESALADTERPAPPASGWTISDDPGRDCLGLAVHGRAAAEEP